MFCKRGSQQLNKNNNRIYDMEGNLKKVESMLKLPDKCEFPSKRNLDDELYLKFLKFKQKHISSN